MGIGGIRIVRLQVAAALCVVLLMASVTTPAAAAGCDIFQLVPCMAASKNAQVMPSKQCCANVAKMGKGEAGAKCLCSLLSNSLAKSQGVVPRIALGIPRSAASLFPRASSAKESAFPEAERNWLKPQVANGFQSLLLEFQTCSVTENDAVVV